MNEEAASGITNQPTKPGVTKPRRTGCGPLFYQKNVAVATPFGDVPELCPTPTLTKPGRSRRCCT